MVMLCTTSAPQHEDMDSFSHWKLSRSESSKEAKLCAAAKFQHRPTPLTSGVLPKLVRFTITLMFRYSAQSGLLSPKGCKVKVEVAADTKKYRRFGSCECQNESWACRRHRGAQRAFTQIRGLYGHQRAVRSVPSKGTDHDRFFYMAFAKVLNTMKVPLPATRPTRRVQCR